MRLKAEVTLTTITRYVAKASAEFSIAHRAIESNLRRRRCAGKVNPRLPMLGTPWDIRGSKASTFIMISDEELLTLVTSSSAWARGAWLIVNASTCLANPCLWEWLNIYTVLII
jgi:hypothetical protein